MSCNSCNHHLEVLPEASTLRLYLFIPSKDLQCLTGPIHNVVRLVIIINLHLGNNQVIYSVIIGLPMILSENKNGS